DGGGAAPPGHVAAETTTPSTTSKDDSTMLTSASSSCAAPVTPHRPSGLLFPRAAQGNISLEFNRRSLLLPSPAQHQQQQQQPLRNPTPPPPSAAASSLTGAAAAAQPKQSAAPLSPHPDRSSIYASPTNVLPRRSRGLDFSRAATSLHHSTLAESSPESSPGGPGGGGGGGATSGREAINIPGRRREISATPFGGIGGGQGPETTSTSLWSIMGDQERMNLGHSLGSSAQAIGSDSSSDSDDDDLMDDEDDHNMEEPYLMTPQVSRTAPSGAFGSPATGGSGGGGLVSFQQRQRHHRRPFGGKKSRLPFGSSAAGAGGPSVSGSPPSNARRDSISWQANRLHISSMDGEDADGPSGDGGRNVVRRAVTRRGNLLPKTKTFARIRAALFEEGAPADAECKREAEVVKQVRDSDVPALEPRRAPPPAPPVPVSAPTDVPGAGSGPDSVTTAPSSPNREPSLDDIPEDDMMGDLALGLSGSFKQQVMRNSKGKVFWDTFSETSSVGGGGNNRSTTPPPAPPAPGPAQRTPPPPTATAAEIARRINNKRRRDDDFDPSSFKRRAVSPSLSVHNSPLPQSPMQRDVTAWGSRPGSNGADRGGSISATSDSGSMAGSSSVQGGGNGSGPGRAPPNNKGRIGFQGMVDTNDGIMRMSIE
ncbi:hypothetical protein GMORB2_4752, partial [Geosmithia morbida]